MNVKIVTVQNHFNMANVVYVFPSDAYVLFRSN